MSAGCPSAPDTLATACGKVILLGEHAVVYGVPALCGALERGALVHAVPGDGRLRVPAWQVTTASASELVARPAGAFFAANAAPSVLDQAFFAILRALHDACGQPLLSLSHDFVASFTIPTGAGLGSSAALAVALARCLNRTLALGLADEHIDAAALAAERVFHGEPSGLDHTVAQHGGFGLFRRGNGLTAIPDLPQDMRALSLVVGYTGRARNTKERVARVAELYKRDRASIDACFSRIARLVETAVAALKGGDLRALGEAMNQNQAELTRLEVSCPEIEHMCMLAHTAGAWGAKLTGGGGGGCVIALAPAHENHVAAAWQRAGYPSFIVQIGRQ